MLRWILLLVVVTPNSVAQGQPPPWAPQVPAAPNGAQGASTFRLEPDKETGGYRCHTDAFTAVVHPDGSVDFQSPRKTAILPFPLNLKPLPLQPGTPTLVGEVGRLLKGEPVRKMGSSEGVPPPLYPAYVAQDTLELCSNFQSRCFIEQNGGIAVATATGPLDLGEELMRALGDDPAKLEKARFLASTSALRLRLAERTRKAELRRALDELPALLNRIWRTPSMTRAERLTAIEALASEISDDLPGAETARTRINEFLQWRRAEQAAPSPQGP